MRCSLAFLSLRTLASACRMDFVSSLTMWNWQIWCGTPLKTSAGGLGYRGEPSVVMPATFRSRASSCFLKSFRKPVMSAALGEWSSTL